MTKPMSMIQRRRARELAAEGLEYTDILAQVARETVGPLSDSAALDALAYLFMESEYDHDDRRSIAITIIALTGRCEKEEA